MGLINCDTFFSIALPPYWITLLEIPFFFFLSICWNVIKAKIQGTQTISWRADQLLIPDLYFLILQICLLYSHVIYILVSLDSSQSSWEMYQEYGVRLMNSGFGNLILSGVVYSYDKIRNPKSILLLVVIFFPGVCHLITHCLPGYLCFIWLPLGFGLFGACFELSAQYLEKSGTTSLPLYLPEPLNEESVDQSNERSVHIDFGKIFHTFLSKFSLVLLISILFPILYNYMILLYGGQRYADVISYEWNLRNLKCYQDSVVTESKNLWMFISFF